MLSFRKVRAFIFGFRGMLPSVKIFIYERENIGIKFS